MVLPYEPQRLHRISRVPGPLRPGSTIFQVYIIYSMQKRQASFVKMYITWQNRLQTRRFLVKLQGKGRLSDPAATFSLTPSAADDIIS